MFFKNVCNFFNKTIIFSSKFCFFLKVTYICCLSSSCSSFTLEGLPAVILFSSFWYSFWNLLLEWIAWRLTIQLKPTLFSCFKAPMISNLLNWIAQNSCNKPLTNNLIKNLELKMIFLLKKLQTFLKNTIKIKYNSD